MPLTGDLSFLAPPDEVCDWRLVVVHGAAAEAGLLDDLPATATELAQRLDLDARMTAAMLDVLCLWNVVERLPDLSYRLSPDSPARPEQAVLRHHARALQMWCSRIEGRLHGQRGSDSGPTPSDPEVFLAALAVPARRRAPALVDACLERSPGARRILDLGGGHGEYALEFARRGCQVVLQDRPEMVEVVRKWGRLEEAGIDLFAGDFFDALPRRQFDLVVCAGVSHTYDAEHNSRLFRQVRSVVAPGGIFVLTCYVAADTAASRLFSLQMLVAAGGGDTHRESEYRRWLTEAGFERMEVLSSDPSGPTVLAAAVMKG